MRKILLILVLVVGLFAEDGYIPRVERDIGTYYSAILASDGKSFYTLKKDLVTHWQLNPIKKLDSFRTGIKPVDENKLGYNIHVTADKSKMVINSQDEIQLWDLKTKKQIKKLKVKTVWGLMDEETFITIDENRVITKYDTKTLKILQTKQLKDPCDNWSDPYGNSCHSKPVFMIKSEDKLIYFSENYLLFLEKNSLDITKDIKTGVMGLSSMDYKTLYYIPMSKPQPSKMINIKNKKIDSIKSYDFISYSNKHYLLGSFRAKGLKISSYYKYLSLAATAYRPTPSSRRILHYAFFDNKREKPIATFLQFKDGEWILIDVDGYFEASSKKVKKYLTMRKHYKTYRRPNTTVLKNIFSDKGLKISDEIYKKYNKKINLKVK